MLDEKELQKECEERQRISDAYIKQQYGDSPGPRRCSHWEVVGGELCSVED